MSCVGVDAAGVRRWRCDSCGLVRPWGDGWVQYGTLDTPEFIACSTPCADALAETHKRPKLGRAPLLDWKP